MRMKKWAALLVAMLMLACALCGGAYAEDWDDEAYEDEAYADDPYEYLWELMDGSTATVPLVKAVYKHLYGRDAETYHSTTPDAYVKLIEGEADLILVTPPSAEDLVMARSEHVELEVIPIVREALIFINNVQNPVENLTERQLRDIYSGRVTNWKDVGGRDETILPFQRDLRSGSQTLFTQCLMRGEVPMPPEKALVTDSMGSLVDQVSAYNNAQGALGYSVHYYISRMYLSEQVRVLSVDGVAPTNQTIADGSYPLYTYYCAVLRKDTPSDDPARKLVAWLCGKEGQKVAASAGYVPLDGSGKGMARAKDWAATHVSSGTGGTEPRETLDAPEQGLLPADLRQMAEDWRKKATRELGIDYEEPPADQPGGWVTGSFLNLIENKWTVDAQGEDLGRETRSAVIDVEKKKFMALSDFFYDGVNYIDYINTHIAFMPERTGLNSDELSVPPFDRVGKRVFSGLPKDYPLFNMYWSGILELLYDDSSPFWQPETEYSMVYPIRVFVPLTHWMSPWGTCAVDVFYRESALDNGMRFLIPNLRIDEGRQPDAESKINAALQKISEGYIAKQKQWLADLEEEEDKYHVEPYVRRTDHYAVVSFDVQSVSFERGELKSLGTHLFDVHTGQQGDVVQAVKKWQDKPEARYYLIEGYPGTLIEQPGFEPSGEINIRYAYVRMVDGVPMLHAEFVDKETHDGNAQKMALDLPISLILK